MVLMTPAKPPFFRDSKFDPFLFAEVGEERGGMLLSVVSALARLDLDPWSEAASLSRLPAAAAAERLTVLLAPQSSSKLGAPAPTTIARLIGLLPQPSPDAVWASGAPPFPDSNRSRPAMVVSLLALLKSYAARLGRR